MLQSEWRRLLFLRFPDK